ncbi:MAG: DUF302 domain-containing protein [Deltaproteobacteria bacterium]
MRKNVLVFAMLFLGINAWAGPEGFVSKPSRYPVPETVDRLVTVLQSKGMTVFSRIDHAAEAAKAGLKMRPTRLLIFGNPKGGTPLMVAAPTVAVDLPFKALVWEDAGGNVWLGYNSPSYLKERHRIQGKDEALKAITGALDAMTDKALE